MIAPAYIYRASCVRVIDGDTLIAAIQLGFYASIQIHVRVYGLWCPELRDPGGPEARDFAQQWFVSKPLLIQSFHDRRSFERWVCEVYDDADGGRYADACIAAGHGTATQ